MPISACKILQSSDYGSMNQQLTSSMSDGWKPMGQMRITDAPRDFFQMMYQGNSSDMYDYQAVATNNATITVRNSVNTVTDTATISVVQSAITGATLPATTAIVKNTQALSVPVTAGILVAIGTATRTVTLSVSGGVVTAAAIS
ncbi:hypothetical protein M2403_002033 [Rahnella sp. BIGb0603]|uniref:hypothetical protein n=1 Tax=Rahnella sp. BIGb0603 TaxID=2940612 RepID=UPI00216A6A8C|nr:hypothetical protein [Rahnella sp. BIGb0603]MCS3423432.1 hypothetical protein [Rahnella sp. BIGb0603]